MNSTKIIAITKPISDELENFSPEEFIAYCARVSNPSNQMSTETSERLLNYCIRNSHWSIFEMINVVMEIQTTRDIARQILRHRSFSFQEFSQRYANPVDDLGFAMRECRLQDTKNRQNSIETNDINIIEDWYIIQENVMLTAKTAYEAAISMGIAKEQARAVLPEGLTVSRMYMNGTLRSWIHYCKLRMDNGTQKEHKLIAESAWSNLCNFFQFLTKV